MKPIVIGAWTLGDSYGRRWNTSMPVGHMEKTVTRGKIFFRYACEDESWMDTLAAAPDLPDHVRAADHLFHKLHACAHRLRTIWPAESGAQAQSTNERIAEAKALNVPLRAIAATGDPVALAVASAAREIAYYRHSGDAQSACRAAEAVGKVWQLGEQNAPNSSTALFYQIATVCYWRLVEGRTLGEYQEPGPTEVYQHAKMITAEQKEGINGFRREGWGLQEKPGIPDFEAFRKTWGRQEHRLK